MLEDITSILRGGCNCGSIWSGAAGSKPYRVALPDGSIIVSASNSATGDYKAVEPYHGENALPIFAYKVARNRGSKTMEQDSPTV